MAASEFRVQPHDAHAHDVTGAIERHTTANFKRLIEEFTKISRTHEGRLGRIAPTDCASPYQPRTQPTGLNSSEGGRPARLMSARKTDAKP